MAPVTLPYALALGLLAEMTRRAQKRNFRSCSISEFFNSIRRVGVWRGGFRLTCPFAAPFVWRCLSGSAVAPFPHPPHRTGQAGFLHPALDKTLRLRPRHVVPQPTHARARSARRGARVDSSRPFDADVVLEAQPPAHPRRRVGVKRPVRLAESAYRKVGRPSAQHAVHFTHQRRGLLPCARSLGQRVDFLDRALNALL